MQFYHRRWLFLWILAIILVACSHTPINASDMTILDRVSYVQHIANIPTNYTFISMDSYAVFSKKGVDFNHTYYYIAPNHQEIMVLKWNEQDISTVINQGTGNNTARFRTDPANIAFSTAHLKDVAITPSMLCQRYPEIMQNQDSTLAFILLIEPQYREKFQTPAVWLIDYKEPNGEGKIMLVDAISGAQLLKTTATDYFSAK